MSADEPVETRASHGEHATTPAGGPRSAGGPEQLADLQLDEVSAGLALLEGGELLPLVPDDKLVSLGEIVQAKDLLAQARPGGRGITPLDHQSRDMD